MNNSILFLIIGMMVVTYIPRLLPFIILDNITINPTFERLLKFIPYAVLGALIIPDGFTAIQSNIVASSIGMVVAILLAYMLENISLVVLLSIIASYLVNIIQ